MVRLLCASQSGCGCCACFVLHLFMEVITHIAQHGAGAHIMSRCLIVKTKLCFCV